MIRSLSRPLSSLSSFRSFSSGNTKDNNPTWSVSKFFECDEQIPENQFVSEKDALALFERSKLSPIDKSDLGVISVHQLQKFISGMHTVVQKIQEVDTTGVEPLYTPTQEEASLVEREDLKKTTNRTIPDLKVNAKDRLDAPFFVVPKSRDEGL